jgi:hypothetical protein
MLIVKLKAINNPTRAINYEDEHFHGLPKSINLSINSKITLVTNIWTKTGLVNGANGVIKDIIYPKKKNEILRQLLFLLNLMIIKDQNFLILMIIEIIGFQ